MIKEKMHSAWRGIHRPTPVVVENANDELIERYLEWKKSYAPPAAEKYAVWVRRFQLFANKAPEALEEGDWTAFANSLEGRFAPKTIQFAMCVIHNYLRYWHEQGRLRQFPFYLAKIPKAIANTHNAISEEEYRLIVDHLRSGGDKRLRDLALIMLLHDSGLRVGEVVRFEIDQVEQDMSAVVQTEKTVQRRRVYWNRDTDEVLQRLIVQRVNSGPDSDWLFVGCGKGQGRGGPLGTKSVQRMMKRAAHEVGIERKLTPHSFRHAFIHRLARCGVLDAVIAKAVGHGSPHSISHYTKLSRPDLEIEVRKQFVSQMAAA